MRKKQTNKSKEVNVFSVKSQGEVGVFMNCSKGYIEARSFHYSLFWMTWPRRASLIAVTVTVKISIILTYFVISSTAPEYRSSQMASSKAVSQDLVLLSRISWKTGQLKTWELQVFWLSVHQCFIVFIIKWKHNWMDRIGIWNSLDFILSLLNCLVLSIPTLVGSSMKFLYYLIVVGGHLLVPGFSDLK